MTQQGHTIWLAFEDENQLEHHMRWEGHDNLESARVELDYIWNAIVTSGNKPPNTYFYSNPDKPLYGYPEEAFDLGEFEKVFADLEKAK